MTNCYELGNLLYQMSSQDWRKEMTCVITEEWGRTSKAKVFKWLLKVYYQGSVLYCFPWATIKRIKKSYKKYWSVYKKNESSFGCPGTNHDEFSRKDNNKFCIESVAVNSTWKLGYKFITQTWTKAIRNRLARSQAKLPKVGKIKGQEKHNINHLDI